MVISPQTVDGLREAVASHDRVRLRGGGSKPTLHAAGDAATVIDVRGLSGILSYDPSEYTFTALAGTPVAEVQARLAGHGQCLPFDPPLAGRGATLGGTVASGLSGSGRYRNGGVRDFILGVRFVDGRGRLVAGGGKVVKNAAGFDLPKLMVGSLGRLGAMAELTFKVFPRPEAHVTVRRAAGSLAEALARLRRIAGTSWDIAAFDILMAEATPVLDVRLGGLPGALPDRVAKLREELGGGDVMAGDEDEAVWRTAREFEWVPAGTTLVKVPVTAARIPALESAVGRDCPGRRYAAGGQVAWLAWPGDLGRLAALLQPMDLAGLAVLGTATATPLIGALDGGAFAERVKKAIDPTNRFG
jgi:glycolate oxidase FAD binding subunit